MKIAISNIAWEPAEETEVLPLLQQFSIRGLEVAPTKFWPEPADASAAALRECRQRWADRGMEIVALQALLFGKPELVIFGEAGAREACAQYLEKMIRLGGLLGAQTLVFGSPKNRAIGKLSKEAAQEIAVPFFRRLGAAASREGTHLCIEPNPPAYGCDYIHTVEEACRLVEAVDHSGFRLHLDASAMTLNEEDYAASLRRGLPLATHFHISEPHLAITGSTGTDHRRIAGCLRELHYGGWCSIEMRGGWQRPNRLSVATALRVASEFYGN